MPSSATVLQIEPDPSDLATLAQVKKYLLIDAADFDSDELLARLITAASSFIQEVLNRRFAVADYVDRVNGSGASHLLTPSYPIVSVSRIAVNGRDIAPAADDVSSGYIADDIAIYLRGFRFDRGVQNVLVVYSAGFAVIPPVVTDCCIELVGKKYKYKDRIGHVSKILAGETITYESSDLTDDMKSVLRNFQKVVPT